MESIHLLIKKIKQAGEEATRRSREYLRNDDIFIVAMIVFVGFGGFGLGRLSKLHEEKIPVVIENGATPRDEIAGGEGLSKESADDAKRFVASVSGSKYHLPWCAGAVNIKEENKIWFATEDAARAAGYTPAANCKGL